MITPDQAKKQFARLSALPQFNERYRHPDTGAAATNEVLAALRTAMSEDDAKAFVTRWLSVNQFLPTPADIRQGLAVRDEIDDQQKERDQKLAEWKRDKERNPDAYVATPEEQAETERAFAEVLRRNRLRMQSIGLKERPKK